jgi:uncharacterized RDD family membrane protein YckC
MEYDFQRASFMKRLPAWLLDIILLITVTTGFLLAWSYVFDTTPHIEELSGIIEQYEEQYGGQLSISVEDYEKMTDEEKLEAEKISQQIDQALNENPQALKLLERIASSLFAMVSLSILCAYIILEFLIPLWLKNGQTLGKKCFGVALMRKDGVKVTPFMMFVRTILGKSTIETMIPVMLFIMVLLGAGGLMLLLGVGLLLAQVIVPVATRNKTAIHDMMACTVAVDLASQMIFDSVEDMEAYNAELHVDKAFEDQE